MPNSYRKIDYRLRPAKSIERKMFADAFRRLSPFARVDSYRYVGFGSLYFSDFQLFHKLFGFTDMVSIEDATDPVVKARFEFNRPYSSIQMKFGNSASVLPKISLETRSIFWLDYDTTLSASLLEDVALICAKASSGSVLIVSICIPGMGTSENDEDGTGPLESLRKSIGPERVPEGIANKDFAKWGTARIYRQVLLNQIQESLKHRNGVLGRASKVNFEQIFNFHYADNMKILSAGGIFFDEGQREIFGKCGFHNLDFYRNGEEAYLIETPLLTFREMRTIERDLPDSDDPIELPIPVADMTRYKRVYRYFPMFAEAEI